MRKHDPVDQRRQQIPDGVALLQNSGEQSAGLRGQRFHRERCAQAPFPAHADAEEGAQDQENGKVRSERGQQFHDRVENDIDHQGNAAAELVA